MKTIFKNTLENIENKLSNTSSDFQHLSIRVNTKLPYDFGTKITEDDDDIIEKFTEEDTGKTYQQIELDNNIKNYYSGMEYSDLEKLLNEYNLSKHIQIK